MPTLTGTDEVIAEVIKIISQLVTTQASQQVGSNPLENINRTTTINNKDGDVMELLQELAKVLEVRESDNEIVAAVKELVGLRTATATALDTSGSTNKVILEAITENISANSRLHALAEALGVKDPAKAIEKVTDLIAKGEELKKLMPELESLKAETAANNAIKEEEDVMSVINSNDWSEDLKPALLMFRQSDPKAFAEKYPKPVKDQKILTSELAVSKDGSEIDTNSKNKKKIDSGKEVIDLASYKGVNTTEKAMDYILENRKNAKKFTYDELFTVACNFKRQENVIDSSAG
jgi:hypothetical protein